MTQHEESNTK